MKDTTTVGKHVGKLDGKFKTLEQQASKHYSCHNFPELLVCVCRRESPGTYLLVFLCENEKTLAILKRKKRENGASVSVSHGMSRTMIHQ